jgi:hypothetical protein
MCEAGNAQAQSGVIEEYAPEQFAYYPKYRFRLMKGRLDSSDRVEVEEFVKVVRRDRFMSINTEGHEDKTREDKLLVMVAVSNMDGRVIFFTDTMEMSRDV